MKPIIEYSDGEYIAFSPESFKGLVMVSGKTEEEASLKFKQAARLALIVSTLMRLEKLTRAQLKDDNYKMN